MTIDTCKEPCKLLQDACLIASKVKELEKENEELRNNGFTVSAMTEQQLKVALEKGEQLERENAELKKKLEYWKSEYEKLFNEQ